MKKKIIIGGLIVLAVAAVIVANVIKSTGAVPAFGSGKGIEVKVEKVRKGNISASVSASGVIEEQEKKLVYFETPVKVKKLLAQKNQKVTKGQKLVELDMDSLYSQLEQEKINKALLELKSTVASRTAAEIAVNNVRSAEREYENRKSDFEKKKVLFETNAISKTEFEMAEKVYKDAEIALQNAKLNYTSAADTSSTDSASQVQNLKAAGLRISDLETKIRKMNEASVSPIDGVIAELNIEEGGFTSNAVHAFKILNIEKLKVRADVKEFDIKSVALGQEVNITGDAIGKDEQVTGKVVEISSVAKKNQTASGDETLIEVIVAVEKAVPVLKPGLSVTCNIRTKTNDSAVIASFEVLKEDKEGNKSVFVVENGVAKERKVKVGITAELEAEIVEGLKEGDSVVLTPPLNLKDGSRVKVKENQEK